MKRRKQVGVILGVGHDERRVLGTAEALIRGCIRTIEATLRTDRSLDSLARLTAGLTDELQPGAGSVVHAAHASGDGSGAALGPRDRRLRARQLTPSEDGESA